MELVYQGTYAEETLIPNVKHQRQYRLEANVLVLEAKPKEWRVAFMTALSLQDARQAADKNQAGPASVNIDLGIIDERGNVLNDARKPLDVPLKGPATLECGFVAPVPMTRVGRHFTWEAVHASRPVCFWSVAGLESCGGIACIKLEGVQQSDDWDHPRADQAAWRRRDTLWILPQLNVAHKVERIIEHRDPAREAPTQRTVVRYELESRLKIPARLFEDRRDELLKARKFNDEADVLARQPALHRPRIETLLRQVNDHLQRPSSMYYRKAFMHVKTVLENARKGDALVPNPTEEIVSHSVRALNVGQRAPDFAVSSLTDEHTARLYSFQGKPVLIVFYKPDTPTGKDVIDYVKDMSEKQPGVAIMAMAVAPDADSARKQHRDMHLTFPILDGNGMRMTFGADQTPRLVLLDGNGYVRMAQTGWGYHTPCEIEEELERLNPTVSARQTPP